MTRYALSAFPKPPRVPYDSECVFSCPEGAPARVSPTCDKAYFRPFIFIVCFVPFARRLEFQPFLVCDAEDIFVLSAAAGVCFNERRALSGRGQRRCAFSNAGL